VSKLSDFDKVKYFNANPRYVEEQIKKKNWDPIMIGDDIDEHVISILDDKKDYASDIGEYMDPMYLHRMIEEHENIYPSVSLSEYLNFFSQKILFRIVPEMISFFYIKDHSDLKLYYKCINLRDLVITDEFNSPIILPNSLKVLHISGDFNKSLTIPPRLQKLYIEELSSFNQPIILPDSLKVLQISGTFNQPIILPNSLERLIIGGDFNHPINIPSNLRYLYLSDSIEIHNVYIDEIFIPSFNQPIKIPNDSYLQSFVICDENYDQPIIIPKRLEYIVPAEFKHLIVDKSDTFISSLPIGQQNISSLPQISSEPNTLEVNDIIAFYYPGKSTTWDKKYKHPQFGNFYPVSITLKAPSWPESITFKNAEAAFQSLKFPKQAKKFSNLTGIKAFRLKGKLSRKGGIDYSYSGYGNNWLGMKAVLEAKFKDRKLREQLKASGDMYLLEHNEKQGSDNIWSDDLTGEGSNWLGLQLMLLRDDILRENGLPETKWSRQLENIGINWDNPPDPPRGKDAWNKHNKPNKIWQKTIKEAISKI
jgi:predicted NAD-dependent protein-ADP-ribosyltransferase YbiA (DUF1768 family)